MINKMTNRINVYLSGAIKNTDYKFQDWREYCSDSILAGFYPHLNIIDPNKFFNYTDKQPKTDKQCMDLFMYLLKKSDVLLVNLDQSNSSVGTGMEVEYAICNNIPIIAFGNKPETWYKWVEISAAVILEDAEEALEYIDNSYGVI
jgi:nucleoside 2-deoxyribosyltransferase|uniref:Deoxyribosyltransferase n=1 Tax=virus sp. ctmTa7 TaxID=2828255 RepID=A0A8S5RCJ0_9VIRU|nr:MAG TPA: deoxyribosyltransferase [virus sp. ctmTa7]